MTQRCWQPGPARPRLDAEAVDVWLVALDGEQPDAVPLSAAERERAARFVRDEDRRRWVAARAALRTLLAAYADADPRALRFEEGPHGKPALAGGGVAGGEPAGGARVSGGVTGLRFNLSHSGDTALIAVARDREVGVDVELPRRAVDHVAIARRVLAAVEATRIEAIEDPQQRERAFLHAWVRWEAVLKCRGTGIGGAERAPSDPEPWVVDLDVDPPAAAALAVDPGPTTVRTWRWPPPSA
jgi:4'-phosphopantetheinyl transferase